MEQFGNSIIEHSQPRALNQLRGCKIRTGIYWNRVLKQKGIKQVECETRAVYTMFLGT